MMLDEDEVVRQVREFFERQGWKTKFVGARKKHFERDIVAEKENTFFKQKEISL
ncbi:MAG: hypothetical protein IBV52_08205 [Candidatus Bathyarchaeota archaeon]